MKIFTLSYDDATLHDERFAGILNRYKLKCTFNVNSGMFPESSGEWRLSEKQCKEIYAGHEVAVHGVKHLNLPELSEEGRIAEISGDIDNLENIFGIRPRGMAYANGKFDDASVETLRKLGLCYARTIIQSENFDIPSDWLRWQTTCHHNNPRLFEFAKAFLETPKTPAPLLFSVWGHSYEFAQNNNWELIEEFAALLSGKDILYMTNIEAYDYIKNAAK